MKNLLANGMTVWRTWRRMRRHQGLFSLRDASMHLNRVLLPTRLHHSRAGPKLRREACIERENENVWRVTLVRHGLVFFWRDEPTDNLWYLIEQEIDERAPHCYTTPPIRIARESLVLDVGACEGLFAFRLAKRGLARHVICFEPFADMAKLIRKGAEVNGVQSMIDVETLAVSRASGSVCFAPSECADTGRVGADYAGTSQVDAVSLDDYCRAHQIKLEPNDLIKIDAEGADFDVLLGAERIIRETGPQIAVTTYHADAHCDEIVEWLRIVQPAYKMRMKGFAFWTPRPRPVLLQAST